MTIMGDDDLVPTFTDGPSGIPSDLKYSLKTDADELPDLAVGRIIGNDLAAVTNAVTKILAYETTAPTGNGMLNKALIAAQFQDDDNDGQENRTFITMAETVRNGLVARGVAVDRVYGEHPGNNPQRFQDGSDLPASLKKPTFGWNGTGAQVSAGWNEGRFMVVHRDHGWSDGWGTPGYGTADVQALTNANRLPVVLSINCSSGAYDYDETSFAGEALVKANGGAVGVFGDTRDSPSTANTQMSLGFVDALLPSVLPGEGPATKQRTGDALNHGKLRLHGISPLPNGTTRQEFYLWHYYGDPSMQMWGGGNAPIVINPALIKAVYKPGPFPSPTRRRTRSRWPRPAAGSSPGSRSACCATGRSSARRSLGADGTATIPAAFGDGSVKPGDLEVAFEGDNAQPVKVPVDGVPPLATKLTQNCPRRVLIPNLAGTMTITGHLSAAPAGSTVAVTFDGSRRRRTIDDRVVTRERHDRRGRELVRVAAGRPRGPGHLVGLVGLCRHEPVRGFDEPAAPCSVVVAREQPHAMTKGRHEMPNAVRRALAVIGRARACSSCSPEAGRRWPRSPRRRRTRPRC